MITDTRACLICGKHLQGRTDKKFCNDYCRNAYNNRLHCEDNNYVRNINQNLRKNRRILEGFLHSARNMARAPQYQLYTKGFRFQFYTHTYTNRKGHLFYFCYDYGYLLLDKEKVLIVRKKQKKEELV